jgi:ActD protein
METKRPVAALYGVMAEFDDTTALVEAARRTYGEGYRQFEAYSPFPIHDLFEVMHIRDKRVGLLVLLGGLTGLCTGLGLQIWVSAIAYPLNIAGRPYISWPMFIPVTFELTILFAAFAAVFGMFGLNGLPMPYHPVFNVERFAMHASQDRFYLAIEARDPKFDRTATRSFLQSLGAKEVSDVEE